MAQVKVPHLAYQENSDDYTHILRGPTGALICSFAQSSHPKIEQWAREVARRSNSHEALVETCKALIREQQFFADHAQEPGRMPGNDFYSDKFMAVVRQAQDALKLAGESP